MSENVVKLPNGKVTLKEFLDSVQESAEGMEDYEVESACVVLNFSEEVYKEHGISTVSSFQRGRWLPSTYALVGAMRAVEHMLLKDMDYED